MNKSFLSRRRVGLLMGAAAAMPAAAHAAQKSADKLAPGGFSAERLKRVTAALQAAIGRGEVDGLVTLIYRHGQVAQVDAVGWQDKGNQVPMARDTIFRIMSMTKPLTAVAAMILIDEGKLKLDVPVAPWLRELAQVKVLANPEDPLESAKPATRPIRLVDLLTHRSGLPTDLRQGPLAKAMREAERLRYESGEAWLSHIAALPLAYEPGSRFAYGNSFDALGILIERVSGVPFADFLRTRIIEPLGMKDTAYWQPKEKLARVASMTGGGPPQGPTTPADRKPAYTSGAYGLMSTVDDYLRFARMLMGHGQLDGVRIVSHRAVALMTTNFLTPEQRKLPFSSIENFWAGEGFGLGVAVKDNFAIESAILGVASPGSFSWPGAYGTWWEVDPKEEMVQVFMVQGGDNIPAKRAFQTTAYEAIDD